jgi:hypothetical protein
MMCLAQAADIFATGIVAGAFTSVRLRFTRPPADSTRCSIAPPPRPDPAAAKSVAALHAAARPGHHWHDGALSGIGVVAARRTRMHSVLGNDRNHRDGQRAAQSALCGLVARRAPFGLAAVRPALEHAHSSRTATVLGAFICAILAVR